MLKRGVIWPATTSWTSQVVLTPRTCATYRFYVGYRRLNGITVRDSYLLPRMEECIDSLSDAKYMSMLDCNWGYWKIPLKTLYRDKNTLEFHSGTYRFNRMPIDLTKAPATFQSALDIALAAYKLRKSLVYLDYIIIFSKEADSLLKHVEKYLRHFIVLRKQSSSINVPFRK